MASVLTAWTETVLRALDARGIDGHALAAAVGIPRDLLEDPESRVPLTLQNDLWHAAIDAVEDDAFGIEVSRHIRAGSFNAVGHAFLSSATLRNALDRSARFARVTADGAVNDVVEEGPDVVLTLGWRAEADKPTWEAIDAIMSSTVRSARFLLGRSTNPSWVNLERPEPRNVERFRSFFACPVRFSAPRSRLAFDAEVADRPIPGGNEKLASKSDEAVAGYLATLEGPATMAQQLRVLLVDAIAAGDPDVGVVAAELAMSARTLQRRLGEEGTTFRDVLASLRCELADALLGSGVSVTQTGIRLGFSETAAFSRAYRRWTGTAPSRRAAHA